LYANAKNPLSMKSWRRKEEIGVSFAVTHQIAKVMTTVPDECLVQMEKALNLCMRA
jgi:hypothetical protein